MLNIKLPKKEQGFTMIEVLAAILMVTVFVTVTMQAMVVAAVFKARAKQYSEATLLIQQDLEKVKSTAAQLAYSSAKCSAISADNGYANYLSSNLPTAPSSPITSSTGQKYNITRTLILPTIPQYNILTVQYQVSPNSAATGSLGFPITISAEVIPDAAFQCP